jgi:glutamyl-tRNA synthetase
VRGRFAPSPTGDVHLGTARTALVAWLSVRVRGGAFVMRSEDLDRARVVPGAEARIFADLRWLGLDWDEGPDVGGPRGPYRQSERGEHYATALAALVAKGRLFACSCSRKDLAAAAARSPSAPHAGDDGPPYPGTCRGRAVDERDRAAFAAGSAERGLAWRFRVDPGEVTFHDRRRGTLVQDVAAMVGDFVVRRGDGTPAYQLAVVVDDIAMAIDEVVRGEDLLGSTPRQILLYRALGTTPPTFAHVALVLDERGQRLAKRNSDAFLAAWRAAGHRPEDVVGHLARSLAIHPGGDRGWAISATELVAALRAGQIADPTGPAAEPEGPRRT